MPSNALSFVITTLIVLVWVEGCKFLAHKRLLSAVNRRKLVHVMTGPIFLCTWGLFSNDMQGALFAASVPAFMTTKFALIGLGILQDDDTVQTLSRRNLRSDILQGPLLYGLVFVASTIIYWKQTRGVIALICLCCGDGFAEIVGRKFGKQKMVPWSTVKTVAGSIGFIAASVIGSIVMVYVMRGLDADFEIISMTLFVPRILSVACVAAFVESISESDIDNFTVFIAAILTDVLYCMFIFSGR